MSPRPVLAPYLLVWAPFTVNALVQAANLSGWPLAPGFAAYEFGLLAFLWTSGMLFVTIVLIRPTPQIRLPNRALPQC